MPLTERDHILLKSLGLLTAKEVGVWCTHVRDCPLPGVQQKRGKIIHY